MIRQEQAALFHAQVSALELVLVVALLVVELPPKEPHVLAVALAGVLLRVREGAIANVPPRVAAVVLEGVLVDALVVKAVPTVVGMVRKRAPPAPRGARVLVAGDAVEVVHLVLDVDLDVQANAEPLVLDVRADAAVVPLPAEQKRISLLLFNVTFLRQLC